MRTSFSTSFKNLTNSWILFSSKSSFTTVTPLLTAVVDVRDDFYSSDHFPVVALFDLKKEQVCTNCAEFVDAIENS